MPGLPIQALRDLTRTRKQLTREKAAHAQRIDKLLSVITTGGGQVDKVGLVELRLENGQYQEITQVHGEDVFETDSPFPLRLVPHWLVAEGAWRKHIGGEPEEAQTVQR